MAEFLLELFVSRSDAAAVEAGAGRARRAAEQLSSEGKPVRFVRTLFMPEEETCFYLYEAASAENVREAARLASLPVETVLEALADTPDGAA
jgi:hypothetical protein